MTKRSYWRKRAGISVALLAAGALLAAVAAPAACGSSDGSSGSSGASLDATSRVPPLPPSPDAGGGGDGAAQLASYQALVNDDSVWTLIQNAGACNLREARTTPDPFPARVWAACGTGCRITDAAPPFQESKIFADALSGGYFGGDAYLQTELDSRLGDVFRVERLSDGATLGAALQRSPPQTGAICVQTWSGSAPLLFAIFDSTDGERFARVPKAPGSKIAWHDTWVTDTPNVATELFAIDQGYGAGTEGSMLFYQAPSAATRTDLGGAAHTAHGLGAQAVWGAAGASVHSYTVASGTVDLVGGSGARKLRFVRLSDDRLVWVDALPSGDSFTDWRWHWSTRATSPGGITVHDGPNIPIDVEGVDMQVGGDWAALVGCNVAEAGPGSASCKTYFWHITTGDTIALPARTGFITTRVLAITPTEVLLGETTVTPSGLAPVQHLLRIDLTAIPTLATTWGP